MLAKKPAKYVGASDPLIMGAINRARRFNYPRIYPQAYAHVLPQAMATLFSDEGDVSPSGCASILGMRVSGKRPLPIRHGWTI